MTVPTYASGYLKVPLVGVLATTGGAIASVANPEGVPLVIKDVKLYVTTQTTGAANMNVGIGAAATTDASDLISALAMAATTGLGYHGMTALAAKGAAIVWGTTQFLNATGDASTVGLVGHLYVEYIRTA